MSNEVESEKNTSNENNTNSNLTWPEIKKASEAKRYELCLMGGEISQRIELNNGNLDTNLFKLTHLNFLELAKTKLNKLPHEIGQLVNLTSLLCHTNELTSVPSEIGKLVNLKNLDLSNNKLTQLPNDLNNLKELFTLNLSGNQLTDLFPLNDLTKLSVINVSRNKLRKLPKLSDYNLENLGEVNASYNEINELNEEDMCDNLPQLKLLNLENNQIQQVPSKLSQLPKLKDLLLKENKLKDNRLKKLIEQDQNKKMKAILDYLDKMYSEELKTRPKSKQTPNKSSSNRKSNGKSESAILDYDLIKVLHFNDEKYKSKQVTIMDAICNVRPFILCCILRNLDLESGTNFKKFLSIQTKIQDEKCEKRTLATIATHDLAAIKSNLIRYDAASPLDVKLIPLGRKNITTARDFYDKLLDEAESERKQKKRNQVSGIYKYLTLLDGANMITYLQDEETKNVISLPPLTNSEITRMSTKTKDILVEITSSESMDMCKQVMESLLFEMLNASITSKPTEEEKTNELKLEELNINENKKLRNQLLIQQVKTVDSKNQLKTVYPSRLDLCFDELLKTTINNNNGVVIQVNRLYDEQQ